MAVGSGHVAGSGAIAVAEQHRNVFVGLDTGSEDRHHVGPVGKIGDAAKAFGLAFGAIDAARAIEPQQLGIGGRIDHGLDLEPERPLRRLRDREAIGRGGILLGRERGAVELDRLQAQLFAIEHERGGHPIRVGLEAQDRANACRRRIERNVELHGLDQPVGWAVILETDGAGLFGAHACVRCGWRLSIARAVSLPQIFVWMLPILAVFSHIPEGCFLI